MFCKGKFKSWRQLLTLMLLIAVLVAFVYPAPLLSQTNSGDAGADAPVAVNSIVVGSKQESEDVLIGKLLILLLQAAGYQVTDATGLGSSVEVRAALEAGEIDLYEEFTGAALSLFHKLPPVALPKERDRSYELARSLDAEEGLIWLTRNEYATSFVMLVSTKLADAGVESLSDLATQMKITSTPLTLCTWDEFYGRPHDGLAGLEQAYGFAFAETSVQLMELDATYAGLRAGKCDVASGLLTDGRIAAWALPVLSDPLGFFPTYVSAPIVRQAVVEANPKLADILNQLSPFLTDAAIKQLNARIALGADGQEASGDEESIDTVAQDFLRSVGLLPMPTIVVGSKQESEDVLIGKLLILLLQAAGYQVTDATGLGSSVEVRAALEAGEIDLYEEFAGTALSLFHKLPPVALPKERDRSYELARSLDAEEGLIWLTRNEYATSFVMLVSAKLADAGVKSLSDLAMHMRANVVPLTLCTWDEFYGRPQDGLAGLEQAYGFTFAETSVQLMELDATYAGLRAGKCDVASGLLTDGRIAAWALPVLSDPLGFFPTYVSAPIVRQDILEANPKLAEILNQLSPFLTDAAIKQLNARMAIGADGQEASGDEESIDTVAQDFLRSVGLLPMPTIVVGSKQESEDVLIGKLLILLLQAAGYQVTDATGLGSSVEVRAALEAGEIDLYEEFTGAALSLFHKLPPVALPKERDRSYELARSLDAEEGLIWLTRNEYATSFVMLVSAKLADAGVESLSDLATQMKITSTPLTLCTWDEFYGRPHDGLAGLEQAYGFTFAETSVQLMELDATYAGLRAGKCDVASGLLTDGRIAAWELPVLSDPLGFFPTYVSAPIVRQDILKANPKLAEILNQLSPFLTDAAIKQLNARMAIGADGQEASGDEESIDTVAQDFLERAGLITPVSSSALSTTTSITTTATLTTTQNLRPVRESLPN